VLLFSSFLSDINCGDETSLKDLSSLYEMLGETPKMATPLQPASVRKRRSLGDLLLTYLFIYLYRDHTHVCSKDIPGRKNERKVKMKCRNNNKTNLNKSTSEYIAKMSSLSTSIKNHLLVLCFCVLSTWARSVWICFFGVIVVIMAYHLLML